MGTSSPNMRFGEFNVVPNGSNFAPGVDMTPKWDIPDKVMINTTVTGGFSTSIGIPITPSPRGDLRLSAGEL